eukprot:Skav209137  [mRNA]  locus=scaffold3950:176033:178291:+ [translate_table: standard]
MNLRQTTFDNGDWFIYLSADASPQGSLEYCIVLEDRISREHAGMIIEATDEERELWCKSGFLETTPLPVTILGSGKASASAKFEALCHTIMLDAMKDGDAGHLTKYASSVISYCSDYGPEANLVNMPNVCIQDLLRNNVKNNVILVDPLSSTSSSSNGGPVGSGSDVRDVASTGGHNEKCYFGMTASMMIPGVKHMFDNIHKELLGVLQHYPVFSATQLRLHIMSLMSRWEGGQPRSWRWSSLIQVLKALLLRKEALRTAWDRYRFGDIGTTNAIHEALTSELFWRYAEFLINVAGLLDVQSSYCEGCNCHEHRGLKHNSYQVRSREIQRRLMSAIDGTHEQQLELYHPSCPLKNRRSAELASGEFSRFLKETMQVTTEKLLECRRGLPDREWQLIANDWMAAQDAMVTQVLLKTKHWEVLPWKLCAIASEDPEVARASARACIRLWDRMLSQGGQPGQLHHSLTKRFLDPVS